MARLRSLIVIALGAAVALYPAGRAIAKEPVRLVFAADLVPLSFEDEGEVRGIFVDVAREVFARLGQPVDTALYPWERAQQMVRQGEADGFITIATKARAEYASCGRIPVLRAPLHPLVRADHPRRQEIEAATDLADFKSFEIVSYLGNGWAKQNLAEHNVFFAADFQASLRGLAKGRGDLAFVTTTAGAYYLREYSLQDKLVVLPMVADLFEYVLCLGKQSPHAGLLPEFDRVLEVMRAEGAYAPILGRYGMERVTFY
ncbi:substrate-binding periplasmic protein [Dongia sp.]|uniref:substrate-binding periplasmic protein n=1 Tax=Dongia sp. TaxID=1977262 RepID=UPI0035ADAB28